MSTLIARKILSLYAFLMMSSFVPAPALAQQRAIICKGDEVLTQWINSNDACDPGMRNTRSCDARFRSGSTQWQGCYADIRACRRQVDRRNAEIADNNRRVRRCQELERQRAQRSGATGTPVGAASRDSSRPAVSGSATSADGQRGARVQNSPGQAPPPQPRPNPGSSFATPPTTNSSPQSLSAASGPVFRANYQRCLDAEIPKMKAYFASIKGSHYDAAAYQNEVHQRLMACAKAGGPR